VRLPEGASEAEVAEWKAPTLLEVDTGLFFSEPKYRHVTFKLSLDKKNRWLLEEKFAEECDLSVTRPLGKKDVWSQRQLNADLSAHVMFEPRTVQHRPTREEKEMDAYFEGLASARVLARQQITTEAELRELATTALPKGVTAPRLDFTLKARSNFHTRWSTVKWRQARVENMDDWAFWAPAKLDDASDYVEVDLGKLVFVVTVGTKGRAARRELGIVVPSSASEWVSRYKMFWKTEEKDVWKSLGEFVGNKDTESEVAHPVLNPHTEQAGLILRYLRIQPISFHGRKSMRIGVYGESEEPHAGESKGTGLEHITSKSVSAPSIIFKVLSSRPKDRAGKFSFSLKTNSMHRRVNPRHRNQANIAQYAQEVLQESAGTSLEGVIDCSCSFPRV